MSHYLWHKNLVSESSYSWSQKAENVSTICSYLDSMAALNGDGDGGTDLFFFHVVSYRSDNIHLLFMPLIQFGKFKSVFQEHYFLFECYTKSYCCCVCFSQLCDDIQKSQYKYTHTHTDTNVSLSWIWPITFHFFSYASLFSAKSHLFSRRKKGTLKRNKLNPQLSLHIVYNDDETHFANDMDSKSDWRNEDII